MGVSMQNWMPIFGAFCIAALANGTWRNRRPGNGTGQRCQSGLRPPLFLLCLLLPIHVRLIETLEGALYVFFSRLSVASLSQH